ncbi:similar to SIGNAL PEPTIDE PEPTIDASE-LIKE 1 [Actinidia rufa]|uniref:Similar to SIGNAL PEPTIDE PEPTIDASE-LIKE 1 n=1 Tax=Actinidia rufa TaxID=165716 RepID=A0A7J0E6F9_9ERIC|nr:similar to SIGNAL PEPTIDE PEPTIDASE-LIKE 1 [Actinidia rufa]
MDLSGQVFIRVKVELGFHPVILGVMEPLWKLTYLLEPAPVTLMLTAIAVTFGSAFRALNYGNEMERNRDLSEASITLDSPHCFHRAIAAVSSLYFCLSPYIAHIKSQFGLTDPFVSRCCSKSFTRIQGLLIVAMLRDCCSLACFWTLDIKQLVGNFTVYCICEPCAPSEHKTTQQASNPVHTVANSLSLPGLDLITKKLELPVKIVFPRNLFGGGIPTGSGLDYMMLGLGDMAIPSMLLALVLCFDHRKSRDSVNPLELASPKGQKYIWCHLTLGPIIVVSWMRKELAEQSWEGNITDHKR